MRIVHTSFDPDASGKIWMELRTEDGWTQRVDVVDPVVWALGLLSAMHRSNEIRKALAAANKARIEAALATNGAAPSQEASAPNGV